MLVALNLSDPVFMDYKTSKSKTKKKLLADKLIRANTPLIARLVTKYTKYAPAGVEMDDLMQAGYIAFLRTLEKIEPPGRPFSTLFAYWVRYEVGKCIEHSSTIYKPRGSGMPYKTYSKRQKIQTAKGRDATAEELEVTQEKLTRWDTLPFTVSMDTAHNADAEVDGLHEVVPDSHQNAEEALETDEGHRELMLAVKDLAPKHRQVVRMIYVKDMSVKDVAKAMHISMDDVVRMEEEALRRLRVDLGDE